MAPSSRPGIRGIHGAAGAATLAAVLVLVAGCTSSAPPVPPVVTVEPGAGPSGGSGGSGGGSDVTGLGGTPVGLATTAGSVWAADATRNQLARLEASSGFLLGTVDVGKTPLRMAVTPSGIWVSEFDDGTVALVDPATVTVKTRVTVGPQPEGLATDGRRLWVVLQASNQLVELDAATGARTGTVRLPAGGEPRLAVHAAAAAGRAATVWVSDFGADRVVPVDARTGKVGTPVAACPSPLALAADARTLWVACQFGKLVAVDLATHRIRGSADLSQLDGAPDAVTVSGGKVWVALSTGPAVLTVDPATFAVTGFAKLGDDPVLTRADIDIVVAAGQVWVSSWNGGGVHHVPVGSLGPPP